LANDQGIGETPQREVKVKYRLKLTQGHAAALIYVVKSGK